MKLLPYQTESRSRIYRRLENPFPPIELLQPEQVEMAVQPFRHRLQLAPDLVSEYEVAFTEYSLALPMEMARVRVETL